MLTHSYIKHLCIDRDFPHKAKFLKEYHIIDNWFFSMKKKTKLSKVMYQLVKRKDKNMYQNYSFCACLKS